MITKTDRLHLEQLTKEDAPFILDLVNRPEWLRFIGDRGVKNLEDAENYIVNGPNKSHEELGYGLFKVSLKADGQAVGMCGLLKRDYLDHPDIGFAFFSEHTGQGYAFEAAKATLDWAREVLGEETILAITLEENARSIGLLEKLGMLFMKKVKHEPGGEELRLYST